MGAFKQVLFLGKPGVGKGTYARRAAPRLGFGHVSPGDLLRKLAPSRPDISSLLARGDLVPETTVFEIMRAEIEAQRKRNRGVILDGFPRNLEQAKGWMDRGSVPDLVIAFELREDILVQKLLGRRVCIGCGDLYNVFGFQDEHYWMPPMAPKKEGVCDLCGSALIQRTDDTTDTIKHRLDLHAKSESELFDYMQSKTTVAKFSVKTGIAQMDELVHLIRHTLNIS